jgi:hypothetical protein
MNPEEKRNIMVFEEIFHSFAHLAARPKNLPGQMGAEEFVENRIRDSNIVCERQ